MLTIFTSLSIHVFYLLRFTPNKSPFFFVCHRLKTEFIINVKRRGAALNRSQKAKTSALSCASAACDHIHDWVHGTPKVDSPSSQIAFDHAELICFYILLFIYLFYLFINFCNFPFVFEIQGKWVSMGVFSDGSYGIPKDIIYSFPVKCEKGKWSIVQGKFYGFYML